MDRIDKYPIYQHGQIQSQRARKQIPHMQWELHSHLAKKMNTEKGGGVRTVEAINLLYPNPNTVA